MRITLIAALLCATSMFLPCAHAQQGDADTHQLAILRAKAETGDAQAESDLGQAFYSGQFGLATNYVEALKWFRKAADQNHPTAQYNLGLCHAYGEGVTQDDAEAVKWFRKSAEQNHAGAQYSLGVCYANGRGVAKDEAEAVKWWRKAAEQNYAWSQFNLGNCYRQGQGVVKDEVEADKWYLLAAAQGDTRAKSNATMLELMLSPEQVAAARKRANELRAEIEAKLKSAGK